MAINYELWTRVQKEMKANLSDNYCVIRFILILCLTNGYQFFICFLGKEAGFKELRGQHPSYIDKKTPPPPSLPSKLTETRGSIPLFSLDGYVMPN